VIPLPDEYLLRDIDPALFCDKSYEQARPIQKRQIPEGEREITGECFEEEILHTCSFTSEEMQKRNIPIKEWLKKREEKIQERDRLRKWIRSWQQPEAVPTPKEDLIKIWQKKKEGDIGRRVV